MIKASTPEIIYVLEILFNLVFITGCFPLIWCEGMITPIFKSGKKKNPNNYRGICVSSCLGKLFCTILNDRILNYTTENDIIHHFQIGFLPGNRTTDHIFTLRTLYENYVLNSNRGKLYVFFVEFKKAFDSIWHQSLFHKLSEYGIDGNIYQLIKNFYLKTKCLIKIVLPDRKTKMFKYARGVRQGCIQACCYLICI